ncbi:hypothetical protein [Aquimarina pacifica]|uniref:hypothetical protein n=1 Tax=Aquimarina pacifica TaxID=1296415 RepID=UPI0004B1A4E7|nr:hypothetical protein [Aquimarina pacifica]
MSYSKIKSEVLETKEKPWQQAAEDTTHQTIGYDANSPIREDFLDIPHQNQ